MKVWWGWLLLTLACDKTEPPPPAPPRPDESARYQVLKEHFEGNYGGLNFQQVRFMADKEPGRCSQSDGARECSWTYGLPNRRVGVMVVTLDGPGASAAVGRIRFGEANDTP